MPQTSQSRCKICTKQMPPEISDPRPVTGEICKECLDRSGAQEGIPLFDFLDLLEVPVLVVNRDVMVSRVNKPVLAILGKTPSQVKGQRGGDVFECAYARQPGGCGKTIHCSGCAIRRAVTETFVTGKSLKNVQAYLDRDTQHMEQMSLVISTEKVLGMILLRIDHAELWSVSA